MTVRSRSNPTESRSPAALSGLGAPGKTTLFARRQKNARAQLRCKRRRRLSANELVRHSPDLGAKLRELLLDRLVATIDVIDPLDVSLPFGNEPG